MTSKLPELICNDKGSMDGVFEVLIRTDYALYKFKITVSAFTVIRCSVARNGETKFEEYEYKSHFLEVFILIGLLLKIWILCLELLLNLIKTFQNGIYLM